MKRFKNWKTALGGVLTAVGLSMQASNNGTTKIIGIVLAAGGSLFTGAMAKDKNVTGGTVQQ